MSHQVIHADEDVINLAVDDGADVGDEAQDILGVAEIVLHRRGESSAGNHGVFGEEELVLGDGDGGDGEAGGAHLLRHAVAGVEMLEEAVDGCYRQLPL